MKKTQFWKIINNSRIGLDSVTPAGNMELQLNKIRDILNDLSIREAAEFHGLFVELFRSAYTWDLWGAASLMNDGCSDDGFMDFRAWLISMGQEVYEKAITDPESLIACADDPTIEAYSFEEFLYVSSAAISPGSSLGVQPSGETWEDDYDLKQRYPKLWERFRDE